MEHNLISHFDDMFELTKDELLALEGFEETKATKLIKATLVATTVPLDRLLIGLGIPHVGEENAYLLATHFGTLTALRAASEETLSRIEGIGPIIGKSVAHWFKDANNRALLARLMKHLKVQKVVAPSKSQFRLFYPQVPPQTHGILPDAPSSPKSPKTSPSAHLLQYSNSKASLKNLFHNRPSLMF